MTVAKRHRATYQSYKEATNMKVMHNTNGKFADLIEAIDSKNVNRYGQGRAKLLSVT